MPIRLCIARENGRGCASEVVYRNRCKRHASLREQGSPKSSAIHKTKRWQMARRRVLFEQPLCYCGEIATDVDHIRPLSEGGDPYDRANLQGLCHKHHSQKTWRETVGKTKAISQLVILVGKAGTGKSAVRRPLAEMLNARGLGPDDHPHRWDWLVRELDRERLVVLECCQIPRAVRARMAPDTVIVELTATVETRRRRILSQGHDLDEVDRRVNQDDGLGYEDTIIPTMTLDTSDATPAALAQSVADRVG